MIRGYFFDLDLCVFDTGSLDGLRTRTVLEAMRKADTGGWLTQRSLREIASAADNRSLAAIVDDLRIPLHIKKAMYDAQRALRAPETARAYDDVHLLEALPGKRILVTAGFRDYQLSKVGVSGVKRFFSEVCIDDADDAQKKGKKGIFQEMAEREGWHPREVLVIGDDALNELKAGKELGMPTVQTLRPGVQRHEGFEFYISSFSELPDIVAQF